LASSSFALKLPQSLHVLIAIASRNSEFAIGQKLPMDTLLRSMYGSLKQAIKQALKQAFKQALE
jgi:hypothetical protein